MAVDGPAGATGGGPRYQAGTLHHDEVVMGTVASFLVHPGETPPDALRAGLARACALLHEVDRVFSTWKADSPVSRLRRGEAALADLPPQVAEVLALCETARDSSGGWFDPWAMPGGVDPTGLVKGWAVQRAADLLAGIPVAGVMVNAGGDLAVRGAPPPFAGEPPGEPVWRVGIRHPWRPDALACVVEARGAVATSGTYERGAHLVDPRTALPLCRVASATVSGPDLALADAYATALAVGGDEALADARWRGDYEAYLIRPDGSELRTKGFPAVS